MFGLNYTEYKGLPIDSQMKTFYISIKFIIVFHVNMMQQIHHTVNSIIWEKQNKSKLVLELTLAPH